MSKKRMGIYGYRRPKAEPFYRHPRMPRAERESEDFALAMANESLTRKPFRPSERSLFWFVMVAILLYMVASYIGCIPS